MSAALFQRELERELKSLKRRSENRSSSAWSLEFLKNYMGTELDILGLSLPHQREMHRRGFKRLRGLEPQECADIWFAVWNRSNSFEALSQVLFFFETWAKERKKLKKRGDIEFVYDPLWPYLTKMVDRIENWAHSDGLSSLLSAALEERPRVRLPLLKKWNRDRRNPWRRRQSIVSLHYYSRARSNPLPSKVTFPMVRALLKDDHFYVQRGVGWTLRECYNVDPAATTEFIENHVESLSAIAFSAATEKMPLRLKSKLKLMRKSARISSRSRRTRPSTRTS